MKKIVVLFLVFASLFSFYLTYNQADQAQLNSMQHAGEGIATPIWIPNDLMLSDPDVMYPLLRDAAVMDGVNVFRTSINYTSDDQVKINKYALLTGNTHFFDAFELNSGKFLNVQETQKGNSFLSTENTGSSDQVGVLKDLGGNHLVEVRPLQEAYQHFPVSDEYFVEASNDQNYQQFVKDFASAVNAHFHSHAYTPEKFMNQPQNFSGHSAAIGSNTKILTYVSYLIYVIALLLLFYYSFYEAKRIGIMKMNGLSNRRLWFVTVGMPMFVSFLLSLVLSLLITFFITDTTVPFLKSVILSQLKTYLILTVISLLSYFYIIRVRVIDAIKNRKDTNAIFVLNTLLKVGCSIALIFTSLSVWNQYSQIHTKQESLQGWTKSNDYGVFYPVSNGNDLADLQQNGGLIMTKAETVGLYPILNQMGSVLIDARAYEESNLTLPMPSDYIRSITINLNYLKEFPVNDAQNKPVQISNDTTDWVLLVPEKYRNMESAIMNFFSKNRKAEYKWEKVLEDKTAPTSITNQQIKIIWTSNNQNIFSFDPEVFPTENNIIVDPIIQVQTDHNSLPSDRMNALNGGGGTDPLKIKLVNGDSTQTLKMLEPELKKLNLDDNLKHLITVDQFVLQQEYSLQKAMDTLMLISLGLLVGWLLLVVQNLAIFFNKHQRKFIIRRLFGATFTQTYKEYIWLMSTTWIVQVIIGVLANKTGMPTNNLLEIAVLLFVIEFLVSALVFARIETRNRVKVLKEGV